MAIDQEQSANTSLSNLGGRLPLLLPAAMSALQLALYRNLFPAKKDEADKGGYVATTPDGALIGPFNSYLFIPEIAQGYGAWIEAQHRYLPFQPEIREAVILTIGAIWKAEFELYAHRARARLIGISPVAIDRLICLQSSDELSPDARVARDFTYALVSDHEIEDGLYRAAKQTFGDEGLVALVHLIGLYLSVSAVLKAFRIPSPDSSSSNVSLREKGRP